MFTELADLTERGRLFQRVGALTAKARSPFVLSLVRGIDRRPCSVDLRNLGVVYGSRRFEM